MKILKILSLFVVLLLASCATTQMIREPIKDDDIINADFNKVWSAMVASISEMSLPIESIEKESGLLTTKMVTFSSFNAQSDIDKISYRPSILLGVWSQGRYSLSVFLQSIENNKTKIKVTTHVEAFESNVSKSWHVCQSKGVLEQQLFANIREKLNLDQTTLENENKLNQSSDSDNNILNELISEENYKYLDIKKILKQYILVTITSDTPMKVGEKYSIVRPSNSYKEIAIAEIVKIDGNNVALKVLENVNITISDKLKY